MAQDTYRIRLEAPGLAARIRPGQFVMVRPTLGLDPLLGRPFALYEVVRGEGGEPWAIDLAYLVMGRGTARLAGARSGDRLPLWGPLGNGFGLPRAGVRRVAMVAGGIGQTPFVALARWWMGQERYGLGPQPGEPWVEAVRLYYGVRTAGYLAGLEDFEAAGVEVRLATNDGSAGYRGYVTELLERDLESGWRPDHLVGCGPEPMLRALQGVAGRLGLSCDLSLENHMACGFGACFSCVAPIRAEDGTVDLKRVCVEGPVFDAARVEWESGEAARGL
ncbi:MAG: dihydroorotate dehydrogenase [Isosphaeraceae bacterium]|nr:MAG: dihydroorotate dehydrogenase [Isosphaeraceae bacterium]